MALNRKKCKSEKMWKKVGMVYFKVLSQHLPEGTKKDIKTCKVEIL
jgi:hypothetical protein